MPFIHIKSLPFEQQLDVPRILQDIAQDFAAGTGIDVQHVHTTWQFYQPGHYAKGTATHEFQSPHHPLIVDLLAPDFNDAQKIALMLEVTAASLAKRAGFPKNSVFINHRQAHSGMVFDDGEVVRW